MLLLMMYIIVCRAKPFDDDSNAPNDCNIHTGVTTETDPKAIKRATQLEDVQNQENNLSAGKLKSKNDVGMHVPI